MIQLQSLQKIYPNTQAGLAGITTQIPDHQWLSIIGPSGCGKTTLLKLISTLEEKTAGTLETNFTQDEISYVFQEPALIPWKTVKENILLPIQLLNNSKKQKEEAEVNIARYWMEKLRILKFKNSYPHELSGGLKMRVSLARALVSQPKLLLLDEPFAALDEPIRIELGLELRDLFKSIKPTIIMVTHSITEAAWLSDRMIVLQGQPGKVVSDQLLPFGNDRPLSLRGEPAFLAQVESCFALLRSSS